MIIGKKRTELVMKNRNSRRKLKKQRLRLRRL